MADTISELIKKLERALESETEAQLMYGEILREYPKSLQVIPMATSELSEIFNDEGDHHKKIELMIPRAEDVQKSELMKIFPISKECEQKVEVLVREAQQHNRDVLLKIAQIMLYVAGHMKDPWIVRPKSIEAERRVSYGLYQSLSSGEKQSFKREYPTIVYVMSSPDQLSNLKDLIDKLWDESYKLLESFGGKYEQPIIKQESSNLLLREDNAYTELNQRGRNLLQKNLTDTERKRIERILTESTEPQLVSIIRGWWDWFATLESKYGISVPGSLTLDQSSAQTLRRENVQSITTTKTAITLIRSAKSFSQVQTILTEHKKMYDDGKIKQEDWLDIEKEAKRKFEEIRKKKQ